MENNSFTLTNTKANDNIGPLLIFSFWQTIFMASLQEQLLKAGLSTKQKARQANTDNRKKNKKKRSGVAVEDSLQEKIKQDRIQTQQTKVSKDNELNAKKQQKLAEKENKLRISQILSHHQITDVQGEIEYNYTVNAKVKKLYLNAATHKALINGRLALCGQDEQSYIVTSETAAKLAELDVNVLLLQNEKQVEPTDLGEDPYADFQIPDDLMW